MDIEIAWTSFVLGLLATSSPCLIPLYPGFLAYLASQADRLPQRWTRYLLGFFVLAGVLTMMLILGGLIAALSVSVGSALSVLIPAADILLILLGILLLVGWNPFKRLPQINAPLLGGPFGGAFLYGLLYGPISLPCSGPLVVSIFAVSLTGAETLARLATFFWFGMGFGLPLFVLSFLAGATQRWVTRQLAMHNRLINVLGGVLLIGIGIYDLWQNWEQIYITFFI